ncbi:hypothetical protein FACS1894181_08310 [Bacteroidia bacterium]|nr:hypothetical protein FACS1894181_08310 [Bacteroidia bacterium]
MKPLKLIDKWVAAIGLIPLLLMQGCVADDLSVCGVTVHFTYTKNLDHQDKFASEIRKVNLYVFKLRENTTTGFPANPQSDEYYFLLGDSVQGNPAQVNFDRYLRLDPGYYKFVVWGNLGDDYTKPVLIKDSTRIDDLAVSLIYPNSNDVNRLPADLYHGMDAKQPNGEYNNYLEISTADLSRNRTLTIDMMKDTKHIKVRAKGLAVSSDDPSSFDLYQCRLSSTNAQYKFDNSITGNVRLRYIPDAKIDVDTALVSDFVIMREVYNTTHYGSSRLNLTRMPVIDEGGPMADLDLLYYLVAYNQYVDSQEGQDILDRRDTYEITLFFDQTGALVSVKIADWEIKDVISGGIGGER